MKKLLLSLFMASIVSMPALADTKPVTQAFSQIDSQCQWIDGYTRKDGTYVQGHWRGCP